MTRPATLLRGVPVGEIAALFASFPRLTPEEAASLARDFEAARPQANDKLRDPWEFCSESPPKRRS